MKHLRALRRKLESGEFGPEDLFAILAHAGPDVASFLESVSAELPPKSPDSPWLRVSIDYAQEGCEGLKKWTANREDLYYALSLAGEVRTRNSLVFLLWLAQMRAEVSRNQDFANAVNLLLSFKGGPTTSASERKVLEDWLLEGLQNARGDAAVANYYCALRGVGGAESLNLLDSASDLAYPYEGVRKLAMKQIRRRMAQRGDSR